MEATDSFWRKCSSCKKPIGLGARYYVCSVSTCNGQRTGYVFCSVQCFESHVPGARHRDAAAVEQIAPRSASSAAAAAPVASADRSPQRMIVQTSSGVSKSPASSLPREVLVIASRLKEYIDARSGYNTSAAVMDVLSEQLRILCDRAIDNARSEGRKTVLDRDFDFLKKS